MEHIPCPVCKTSGGVPVPSNGFVKEGSSVRTTGRCPLCWGVGHIPPLEAFKEKVGAYHNQLALHYWECNCFNTREEFGDISNIHPDTHEYCLYCRTAQDDGNAAVALLVQAWLADLGAELDIVWVEQEPEEDVIAPAPAVDERTEV